MSSVFAPTCRYPSMWSVNQDLAVIARKAAAAMRDKAWDRQFRPFHHNQFMRSVAVQRFVPGPTWSYLPPRDRPGRTR